MRTTMSTPQQLLNLRCAASGVSLPDVKSDRRRPCSRPNRNSSHGARAHRTVDARPPIA